jgi:hypothetical protein
MVEVGLDRFLHDGGVCALVGLPERKSTFRGYAKENGDLSPHLEEGLPFLPAFSVCVFVRHG